MTSIKLKKKSPEMLKKQKYIAKRILVVRKVKAPLLPICVNTLETAQPAQLTLSAAIVQLLRGSFWNYILSPSQCTMCCLYSMFSFQLNKVRLTLKFVF